ncbi:restriction endonuclease subunit S [Rhizobium sp. NZLR10]|uniref:restriction endonuclease subunit S n=1 Tax=Rhizobium sp. NZLR10 TaxID=2731097 RepID=UPI001C839DB2|nr:restriction endonuclease subunit S [Rhizobium sp. NZLR10]MBX5197520.1 restriction endonuclease subunit S [Rhizobium sp. NZLR10]
MSYAPYPAYKDSGVPRLGLVPVGWETSRIDFQCTVKARLGWKGLTASEYVDEGYVFLATPNIKGKEIDFENVNYINEQRYLESPEIMIEPGDVLLAKDGSTLGTTNFVRSLPRPATVNSSIAIVRPRKNNIDGAFIFRWIEADIIQSKIQEMKDGQGVPHLFQSDIRKFPLPLPPLDEQMAIARFLDEKTAEIDSLIARMRELLRRLSEQRTALITHAVTKGLNPDTPMKPSGIDWLGDVPEGWEVKKIKYLASYIGSGKTPRGGAEIYTDEGVMILRSQNVYDDGLRLNDVAFVPEEVEALQRNTRVREGDVLLNITGASIGRSSIVPATLATANVNQHVCIFRSIPQKLQSRFLHAFFCSSAGKEQVSSNENGTSREGLNFRQAGNLVLALPPLSMQNDIVEHLDAELAALDKVVKTTGYGIERLKEYRTALITDAVTGKIKVA